MILSACYALWLYRKVIFGVIEKPALAGMRDLGRREILVFAPLVLLTILFGVYPEAGARHVGGLGRAAAGELSGGDRAEEGGRAAARARR